MLPIMVPVLYQSLTPQPTQSSEHLYRLDPPLLLVLRLRRVVFKHISRTKSKIIFKSFINNRSELN